jgi:hypothetical protein
MESGFDPAARLSLREMCKKLLLNNILTAQRTLRPKVAHCRIGEKSKQNQSTDRAAMCGLLSGLQAGHDVVPSFSAP